MERYLKALVQFRSFFAVSDISAFASGTYSIFSEVKERNKKKLNSHRWFFNAFGPLINPNGKQ